MIPLKGWLRSNLLPWKQVNKNNESFFPIYQLCPQEPTVNSKLSLNYPYLLVKVNHESNLLIFITQDE